MKPFRVLLYEDVHPAGKQVLAEKAEIVFLLYLENVVLTPHMAAHTDDALRAMSLVAEDVLRVLEGEQPVFRVV